VVNRSIVVVSAMVVGLVAFGVGTEVVAREIDDRSSTSGVPRHSANATKDDVQAEIHGKTVPGPSPCLKAVGRWSSGYGAIESLASVGDSRHVLVGRGTTLVVVDVGEPWAMTPVAELILPGLANHIVVDGGIAIIAVDRAGIVAIDVSDPAHPHITDTLDTPGRAVRVAMSAGIAAVADEAGGLRLVNYSNSQQLHETAVLQAERDVRDVAMQWRTVAFAGDGIQIVDVSDPARPEIVSSIDGGGSTGLAMNGRHLIATIRGELGQSELGIFDVFNPASPVTVVASGFIRSMVGPFAITWVDDVVLVETDGEGVHVVDVSERLAPRIQAHLMHVNPVSATTVVGSMVITAWEDSLEAFALDRPLNPEWDRVVRPPAEARSMAASGVLAVLGLEGSQVAIVDVSDVDQPTLISTLEIPGTGAPAVAVRGDLACAWSKDGGVVFIDLENPSNPVIVSRLEFEDMNSGYLDLGDGFAAVGWSGVIRIVDLSDPAHPVVSEEFDSHPWVWPVFQDDVMFVERLSKVRILQRANGRFVEVGSVDPGGGVLDLAVSGDRLYVFTKVAGDYGEHWVYDIADLADPQLLGILTRYHLGGVPFEDSRVLFSLQYYELIDTSHPPDFRVIHRGPFPVTGARFRTAAIGSAFGFASGDFWILDPVRDRPTADGSLDLDRRQAVDAIPWDDRVIVIDGKITVFDVSEPTHPSVAVRIDTPGSAKAAVVDGDRLLVADGSAGLSIFDLPGAPSGAMVVLSDSVNVGGDAVAIAVVDTIAYVAVGGAGLALVDLETGVVLKTIDDGADGPSRFAQPRSIEVSGDLLYAGYASSSSGLHVYDVSEPSRPEFLGRFHSTGVRGSVVVEKDRLVGTGYGFPILDISDPAAPVTLGVIETRGKASDVAHVKGHRFVFADGTGGVFLADLSDPADPRILRRVQTPGEATGLAVTDAFVYVADGSGGLSVLDRSLCPLGSGERPVVASD
jgi:hypothetical protein